MEGIWNTCILKRRSIFNALRFYHRLNVLYTCTEDIEENGQLICYQVSGDGKLTKLGQVDAGGKFNSFIEYI